MVTAVAVDSRVQKLPRVRGGSYTGEAVEVFINTVPEKYLYISPEPEKPEKYLYIHTFYNTFPGPNKYLYTPCWRSIYTLLRSRRSIYIHRRSIYIHRRISIYTLLWRQRSRRSRRSIYIHLWLWCSGLSPVLVSIALPVAFHTWCFPFALVCHWISIVFLLYGRRIATHSVHPSLIHSLGEFPGLELALVSDVVVHEAEQQCAWSRKLDPNFCPGRGIEPRTLASSGRGCCR